MIWITEIINIKIKLNPMEILKMFLSQPLVLLLSSNSNLDFNNQTHTQTTVYVETFSVFQNIGKAYFFSNFLTINIVQKPGKTKTRINQGYQKNLFFYYLDILAPTALAPLPLPPIFFKDKLVFKLARTSVENYGLDILCFNTSKQGEICNSFVLNIIKIIFL